MSAMREVFPAASRVVDIGKLRTCCARIASYETTFP